MTEQATPPLPPRELTFDELVPIAVALEHRRRQQSRGMTLVLRPLPVCPDCGAAPEGLVTTDEPFRAERLVFRPCGHAFVGRAMDVYEAAERARDIVDAEENRPVGERREPAADPRDAEVARLRARVAELERRQPSIAEVAAWLEQARDSLNREAAARLVVQPDADGSGR